MYKVYLYTNKINNKKYCGLTKNTIQHRRNGGYYKAFGNALKKYGLENFDVEILYEVETLEEASKLEQKTINELNLLDRRFGYNIAKGGFGGYSCAGYTHEEMLQVRQKLRQAQLRRYEDVNERYKCANYGKSNGNFGKGLPGKLNGRAKKVAVIMTNGTKLEFDTQLECRKHLEMGKDLFMSIVKKGGVFKISPNMNTRLKEKYAHLEGIQIVIYEENV